MRKFFASLIALFYVLVLGSQVAHIVFVPHALCLEHGELTHSAHQERADTTEAAKTADATIAGDADDIHCEVKALCPRELILPVSPAIPAPPAVFVVSVTIDRRVSVSSTPLYRLSPSNSPPKAAPSVLS